MSAAAGGRGRVRDVAGHRILRLADGWQVASSPANALDNPAALQAARLEWLGARAPSTVASTLRDAGLWSLDGDAYRFDADDWWYRTTFEVEAAEPDEQLWLCFDGLATVADVWLNGQPLLSASGMFTAHECRVDANLRSTNELVIRFRALDALRAARRPRPRWRAPMVEHQQLRWFRTTLLGRTPGWSPPAAAVGPWRGVRIERRRHVSVGDVHLDARGDGLLRVECRASRLDGAPLSGAELVLEREGRELCTPLSVLADGHHGASLHVPRVEQWFPHTHGPSPLYSTRLRLGHGDGTTDVDLGKIGFRTVELSTADDDFEVRVNNVPVFCRGACWTPLDVVSLDATDASLDAAFAQVVAAGMNMLRVGGTMVYESDAFLDRCDANGVLLWHDFMFANMDYPDDADFVASVEREARQALARLQARPSVAIICGNSEVEQQAAMWGAERSRWAPALFHERLAALSREACPSVPYWPSSAHGGTFPHQVNAGSTSYYGVGAYFGPVDDARRANVRFASECLAFANVPEERSLDRSVVLRGVHVQQPIWKERSPRDLGAGWDFDDVRDHYLAELFRVDPVRLRASNHRRYLELGRVATGEAMSAAFAEWRRAGSATRGALIWFLRDLWDGAGWGVVDATGEPKAAWYYLRRALAPVALFLTNERCSGLEAHVVNDGASDLDAELELVLIRGGDIRVAQASRRIAVPARGAVVCNAMSLFDGFHDLSYAYRFGPASHDLVAATLTTPRGKTRAVHFVDHLPSTVEPSVGLEAELRETNSGAYEVVVRTQRFAQSVHLELDGFVADDNYFHLCPGEERRVTLRRHADYSAARQAAARGAVRALNSAATVTLVASMS